MTRIELSENVINAIADAVVKKMQEPKGRIAGMKKEHDGCVACRFKDKKEHEEPCRSCSHCYVDKWKAKE